MSKTFEREFDNSLKEVICFLQSQILGKIAEKDAKVTFCYTGIFFSKSWIASSLQSIGNG